MHPSVFYCNDIDNSSVTFDCGRTSVAMEEEDDERPVLESGEVVCVPAEAIAAAAPAFYRVEDLIGEGRCCLVRTS